MKIKRIIKVQTSQGCLGKNIGCESAPKKILEEIKLDKKIKIDEIKINKDNFLKSVKNIEEYKLEEGDFFLGGDHSITYPLTKNLKKKFYDKKIGLIIFDAHPDCVNNFSPPTHEDFIRVLIEEKIFKPEEILLIGIRAIDKVEEDFLKKNKIKIIYMKDISEEKIEVINKIKKFLENKEKIYLSIDIDVLDEIFCPGTGYPEKKGFKLEEFISLLRKIKKFNKIKIGDLVEVNLKKDKNNQTMKSSTEILKALF